MKKLIWLTLICCSFMVSCGNDFLNLNPQSNLNSDGFYTTQTDMNMAVLSAYSRLRTLYGSSYYIAVGEVRSDNTTYSWLAGNPANERQMDEFKEGLLENNSFLRDIWNNAYNLILRSNIVIDRINAASFDVEALRTRYEAEARFLRASTYFWLNRIFGGYSADNQLLGVCKVDKPISQFEAYEIGRSTLQEIYDFIIEDLTFAQTNLPRSYESAERGRITQAGAAAMLAKVYMFMAGYPLNKGNEYYTKAIQQIEYVFTTYPEVQLAQTYQHLFSSPHNQTLYTKNSVESLFEIQYIKGAPGENASSEWNNNFAPRFSDKEVVLVGDKGGVNAPTVSISEAYELGDPRKYVCMRDGYTNANTGAWEPVKYVCKYYDVPLSGSSNGNNWIELRLADIYLLYSEALILTGGNKTTALNYLNKIRERARNTPGDPGITPSVDLLKDYTLADFANDEAFLLAIENERRVELAFENHRWFDLVRTGRAKDVMVAHQTEVLGPFTWNNDKMLHFPIPETVMQSNPQKITQNKGFTQM